MKKEYWIKYKWDDPERYSLYTEQVKNTDFLRLPHKSREEAEYWITRIADGINLVKSDFYIKEVA